MPTKAQTEAAASRIQQVRASMKKAGVDALVINNATAIRYLTGFSGSAGMVILSMRTLDFFTNDLYAVQVTKELVKINGLKVHVNRDFWGAAKQAGLNTKFKSIGFNAATTTVLGWQQMKKGLSPAKLVDVGDLISKVTAVKTKSELRSISKAAEITSQAYQLMLGMVQPGMTEHEVATFVASRTRELGSERDAFDIIVVSGKRSAMPHGRATQATITSGSVVTVDFGCCIDGLYSDMTRTFFVGKPSKQVVDVFAVLYDAHLSALDAVKEGVTGSQLDAVARNVITEAGYGEYFRHSLGHGLGYDVHENPRIAPSGSNEPIEANTVITIEPGIYIPDKFGMRIEDDVVVTKRGSQILTSAPRELVVV